MTIDKSFLDRKTNITAKVVADSISEVGDRVTKRVIDIPKVGSIFENSKGCLAEVVSYENHKAVTVRFLDSFGYVAVFSTQKLKNGCFKNLYFPSVHGVGYLGLGDYKTSVNGVFTPEYRAWCAMLSRCYCSSYKEREPSYDGCTVHTDWLNFQVFSEWYCNQRFYGVGYQLDKDILVKGNKIYSQETCCLVPNAINSGVKGSTNTQNNSFGISERVNGKFQLKYSEFGKVVHVGDFHCLFEARKKYLEMKELYIKKLAEIYKESVDDSVYNVLSNWKIELTGE